MYLPVVTELFSVEWVILPVKKERNLPLGFQKPSTFIELLQKQLMRYICCSPDAEALNTDHNLPSRSRSGLLASPTTPYNLMNSHI